MLTTNTSLQINKPIAMVYNSVYDPKHMSQYFISESDGVMKEGAVVNWKFPEFDDIFPVIILASKHNETIVFNWSGADSNQKVTINFEATNDENTIVKIAEGPFEVDKKSMLNFGGQSAGWANFLACLKAYLEYGINLRKGAFDFMKTS